MATHSPFTRPTPRANRISSAPTSVTASRCIRRNSAPNVPATTSTQCSADIPLLTAARNEFVGGSRTGKASADPVDHNWVARSQRPQRAQSQPSYVESLDKRIDYPANVIIRDKFFQTYRKQRALRPPFSL